MFTASDANLEEIAKAMIAGKSDIKRSVSDLGGVAGGEKYIAYAPIVSTNWSLGVVKPVTEITAPATKTRNKIDKVSAASREQIDRHITRALLIMALIFIAMTLIVVLASRAALPDRTEGRHRNAERNAKARVSEVRRGGVSCTGCAQFRRVRDGG